MKDVEIEHTTVQKLIIDADQADQRIDNFLLNYLKNVPKTRIYKMLRKGEVRVNGGRIKPPYRLQADDQVRVPPVYQKKREEGPSASLNDVKRLESCIVYESERLIVLNKPSGIAVHGGSGLSFGVIEAMRSLRPEQKYLELVHRIDRDTSGCLLIAKRRSTLRYLQLQFRERTIKKTYHAVVAGHWPKTLKKVSLALEKSNITSGEKITVVSEAGKPSLTYFKVLDTYTDSSLIEASPKTGRTHQIRVHCAASGHVICGDSRYDVDNVSPFTDRLFLHAFSIEFKETPESNSQTVSAEVDLKWSNRIEKLATK